LEAKSQTGGEQDAVWKIMGVESQFQHISVTTPIAVPTICFTGGSW